MNKITNIYLFLLFMTKVVFAQQFVTSKQYYIIADSIAKQHIENPYFLECYSESIDNFGKSDHWYFRFDSLKISIDNDTVIIDTSFQWLTGYGVITEYWMDSDSAINIAYEEGGKLFIEGNNNYTISASLFHNSGARNSEWDVNYRSNKYPYNGFRIFFNSENGSEIYKHHTEVTCKFLPLTFRLYNNFPNLFNASTKIQFDLPRRSTLDINVYNIYGQIVSTKSGSYPKGKNEIRWTPENIVSGIYISEITFDNKKHRNIMSYIK